MPFRSFLVLLTVEDQIQTLKNIRKHMKNGGFLMVDLFAPRYDLLSQSRHQAVKKIVNPQNRHVLYRKEDTMYDNARQLINATYIFEEYDEKGNLIRSFQKFLRLRYVFRRWRIFSNFQDSS